MQDELFMQQALELARTAAAEGEVPVGCVIVQDGTVIGRGPQPAARPAAPHWHMPRSRPSAEACRRLGGWRLWQATLYVTLEPWSHVCRRDHQCSDSPGRHRRHGPQGGSCGSVVNLFDLPYNHRPEITRGVLEDACASELRTFFRTLRARRREQATDLDLQ